MGPGLGAGLAGVLGGCLDQAVAPAGAHKAGIGVGLGWISVRARFGDQLSF